VEATALCNRVQGWIGSCNGQYPEIQVRAEGTWGRQLHRVSCLNYLYIDWNPAGCSPARDITIIFPIAVVVSFLFANHQPAGFGLYNNVYIYQHFEPVEQWINLGYSNFLTEGGSCRPFRMNKRQTIVVVPQVHR
jgi:hypothetical protein